MALLTSEVMISDLFGAFRLDAECYTPEVINAYEHLESMGHVRLGDHTKVTDGQHGYHKVDDSSPIRHLTAKCIREFFIDDSDADRLSVETHKKNPRSALAANDVLLSTAGTLGNPGIVTADVLPANIDQDVARITPTNATLDPWYLVAFLDSHIGRLQSERVSTGQVQKHIALEKIRDLMVPTEVPQQNIVAKVKSAFEHRQRSLTLYAQAEGLLLSELGLGGLDLPPTLFYERSFSETREASRLDAEYFQPKYRQVMEAIRSTRPERIAPLEEFLALLTNGHTPRHHDLSEGDVPFLTAEHVFDFRIDYDSEKRILREHHDGELKQTRLKKGDCLITIKGRIGNAAIAEDFSGPVNINQDVALFRLKNGMPPYYLMAYLNSQPGKAFTRQYCTGQINPFLGLGNIRQLPVPVFESRRMERIAAKTAETVLNARAARDESRRLLDEAKQMVEKAVLGG